MRKIIVLALLLFVLQTADAQILHQEKYNLYGNGSSQLKKPLSRDRAELSGLGYGLIIAWPVNPMLVVEDKKAYFALTKEFDVMFPAFYLGTKPVITSLGGEYSFVARNGRNSHIRGFLDFYYPIEAGEYIAILGGIGGGYFTDTKKSGIFPQASVGALLPLSNHFGFRLYLKARHTFMIKKEDSDIFDFSAGAGITVFPSW